MSRRILVFGLFLLIFTGAAMASDLVMLEPEGMEKAIRGPIAGELDEMDDLFFVRRYTSAAEFYLGSGDLGDTMCVVFQPLAACSIYYAEQQWFTDGNYQSFVWLYSDEALTAYPDGRSPNRGTSEVSPLGDVLFGPYNNAADSEEDWDYLFTEDDLLGGGIRLENGEKFVVGFVKTAEGGDPAPLADDVSGRRFTYTWFGGPWMAEYDETWGAYSSDIQNNTVVDMMMRVAVAYYDGAPPIIGSMSQLPNTLNANKECTVVCEIIDNNGWDGDSADLMVKKNDGTPEVYPMTQITGTNDFTATFTINGAVGDTYYYWIEAEDDEGATSDNMDEQLWFDIVELSRTDADMLVIDHGSGDTWAAVNYWAWENHIWYEFWEADYNKGIDEFTLSAEDWTAVLVFGWASATVPTRGSDNAYQDYVEGGGNFFYADMDYFYGNNEDDEPTFEAGDFAYDVLGISGGLNDPTATDSVFYGEADDPISGSFEEDPYTIFPEWSGNYADGITGVASAVNIFTGEDNSINGGIRYDTEWNGKSVYLALDAISAVTNVGTDEEPVLRVTEQFSTLMNNVFTYFQITTAPETRTDAPQQYALSQNYPNPFNPSTQITFTVPQAGKVAVKVYNLSGQEVATLYQGQMTAGSKSVTFDASNLASGVYFYRMEADGFSAIRKMMLIK